MEATFQRYATELSRIFCRKKLYHLKRKDEVFYFTEALYAHLFAIGSIYDGVLSPLIRVRTVGKGLIVLRWKRRRPRILQLAL